MNLNDRGRVEPRATVMGQHPGIDIKMETQIEKLAFYRENVHRSFNYVKPWNLVKGAFWLVVVPYFSMKLIISGQVRIFNM